MPCASPKLGAFAAQIDPLDRFDRQLPVAAHSHSFIPRQTKYLNIQHKEFFVAHQTVEPARLKNAAFEIVGNFPAH
jgi:hypothetical protein